MTENAEPLDFELRIYNMISDSQDRLFERFDDLHKRNIDDTQVIQTLRKGGYRDLAEGYIEWSGAIDPDAEDDNTTMNPVVPDPGDAPSYSALTVELTAAGINDGNLEQALLDAATPPEEA